MRHTLRVLSLLLGYPSAEVLENIGVLRRALRDERTLPLQATAALDPLFESLRSGDLLDAQTQYSELFDRSRHLSLHLFEHVHGDGRERGQALIDLGQFYIDHGFVMVSNELPDFLPLFLEFLSCLPPDRARDLLAEPAHVFVAIEERLREHGSPYAALFAALSALAATGADEAALQELRARHSQSRPIDEEWEDAPVDFGRPTLDAKQATGVVARIHAAQQAVAPQKERTGDRR